MNQTLSRPGPALVLGVGTNLEVMPEVELWGSCGLGCFRILSGRQWGSRGRWRGFGFLFFTLPKVTVLDIFRMKDELVSLRGWGASKILVFVTV